ncbi:MAG: arginine decarboxylase, partial [Cytophagales bacterium]|nr:arginine decarboxylase [Cytophagales bacterium]
MNKYIDLIKQTFDFPTKEFEVSNNQLHFNGVNLLEIIEEYGTPLKLTYLPKISENIQNAKKYFGNAMKNHDYKGSYTYCYCTKSSHFSFVVDQALKNGVHIETSSTFDIPLVRSLYEKGKITKDTLIVCNGFKRDLYKQYISELLNDGFVNCIPVLDNITEIDYYLEHVKVPFKVGIRIAADEEPTFGFYTSRLGVRYNDIIKLYEEKIKNNPNVSLKMLHFFINSGIRDTAYYWSELTRFIQKYVELKKVAHELDTMDIGGGWPIKTNVFFDYDYQYMADQIIKNIKWMCAKNNTVEPNILTEFGSYTVGESGAVLYS